MLNHLSLIRFNLAYKPVLLKGIMIHEMSSSFTRALQSVTSEVPYPGVGVQGLEVILESEAHI